MDLIAKTRTLDSSGPKDVGRDGEKGSHMNGMACEAGGQGSRATDRLGARTRSGGLRLIVEDAPPSCDGAAEEHRLIVGCMLGEEEAWATIFRDYHPRLLSYLQFLTRMWGGDRDQAEEVAFTIWCGLYDGTARFLKKFDPAVGGLLRCLKNEARALLGRRRRSELRGRLRETAVARREATHDDVGYGIVVEEFLATLTRREREFCSSILLTVAGVGPIPPISETNEYVLRCRVLRKLRTYMIQNN
jgi:DNA-directed RNA polymerase specialized sigma24 family protein